MTLSSENSMKYKSKDVKQRAIDRKFELANLWMECDGPSLFWLRQKLEIPDATSSELRALKIYWFKMCHPVLYMFYLAMFTCLCAAVVVFNILQPNNFIFTYAVIGCFAVVIGHLSLHVDMMEIVEWYEDGQPIDY